MRQGVPQSIATLILSTAVFGVALSAQTPPSKEKLKQVPTGKALFTKSCVRCHGANGKGGEGPKLKGITMSDARITKMIKNGKPGEMPAFGDKLKAAQIKAIVAYLHSLK